MHVLPIQSRISILILLLIGLLLSFNTLSGQEVSTGNPNYIQVNNTMGDVFNYAFQIRPEGRYQQIKGSPYLYEEWIEGRVKMAGDSVFLHFPMRYNLYANEMQFIFRQDTFAVANPLAVEEIQLEDHRFVYLPFHHRDNLNMAYFEILVEGPVDLLLRRESRLEWGTDPVTPYHCQNDHDRFVKKSIYYYWEEGQDEPVEMPPYPREVYRLDFVKPHKEYIKENRLKVRKEDDLIQLFNWINKQAFSDAN